MFPSKPGELQTDVRRNRKDQMHLTAYHPRITPEHDSFRIKNIVYSHNKK